LTSEFTFEIDLPSSKFNISRSVTLITSQRDNNWVKTRNLSHRTRPLIRPFKFSHNFILSRSGLDNQWSTVNIREVSRFRYFNGGGHIHGIETITDREVFSSISSLSRPESHFNRENLNCIIEEAYVPKAIKGGVLQRPPSSIITKSTSRVNRSSRDSKDGVRRLVQPKFRKSTGISSSRKPFHKFLL